jgi:hypothetical protein
MKVFPAMSGSGDFLLDSIRMEEYGLAFTTARDCPHLYFHTVLNSHHGGPLLAYSAGSD